MSDPFHVIENKSPSKSSVVLNYTIGFILSLFFTMTAFYLVYEHVFAKSSLILAITGLGIVQTIVQLVCFLHLGDEEKPRWNLMAFLFMILVLVLLVFGSLWIMHNLDGRMMPDMSHMNMKLTEQR